MDFHWSCKIFQCLKQCAVLESLYGSEEKGVLMGCRLYRSFIRLALVDNITVGCVGFWFEPGTWGWLGESWNVLANHFCFILQPTEHTLLKIFWKIATRVSICESGWSWCFTLVFKTTSLSTKILKCLNCEPGRMCVLRTTLWCTYCSYLTVPLHLKRLYWWNVQMNLCPEHN